MNPSGQESARPIAGPLTCPADGEGFAVDKGRQRLKLTTSGAWSVDVEQQVDSPLIEAAPAALGSAKVLGTARLYNLDRIGAGTAKLYEMADGTRPLRLEDFFVTANSDSVIGFSELAAPRSTEEMAKARSRSSPP